MEHHAIADLLTVGARGAVSCRCGWSAQVVGSRSALLDAWAAHVKESDAAELQREPVDRQSPTDG